jgi:hypothetical protein
VLSFNAGEPSPGVISKKPHPNPSRRVHNLFAE